MYRYIVILTSVSCLRFVSGAPVLAGCGDYPARRDTVGYGYIVTWKINSYPTEFCIYVLVSQKQSLVEKDMQKRNIAYK